MGCISLGGKNHLNLLDLFDICRGQEGGGGEKGGGANDAYKIWDLGNF